MYNPFIKEILETVATGKTGYKLEIRIKKGRGRPPLRFARSPSAVGRRQRRSAFHEEERERESRVVHDIPHTKKRVPAKEYNH